MFIYTRAYFKKLNDDIKTVGYVFNILSPLIYIAYLVYAMFVQVGYLWANVALLTLTVSYLIFYLVTYDNKSKSFKSKKIYIKHIYKAIKLSVTGMTLGITIYGIYVASTHTTTISIVLSCFMALFWACQLIIEIMTYALEYQTALFLAALEADKDNLMKPITTVGNFVKKVTGKEIEGPKEPNKMLKVLEGRVQEIKENKKNKGIFSRLFNKDTKSDAIDVNARDICEENNEPIKK